MNLHPDDLLFYNEVTRAMRRVAKLYDLPFKSVEAFPMPQSGMADRMGDCSPTGHIRLVLRCTVDGQWCDEPLSPKEVWDTAAHELAHLRHMNHGVAFQEFLDELTQALQHQQVDHKAKVLDRLVKMQASRQSEAEIGNTEAAEAFAGAINRMLIAYELSPSDIDYARATDHDPVIEIRVDLTKYRIKPKKARIAWQESLARIVARAHLCSFLIHPGSNRITFVGTASHATVAEYVYGTLLPAAGIMATKEYYRYESRCRAAGDTTKARGYWMAWMTAFIERIAERFDEARKSAVAEAPEGTSVALVRLDGALIKTRRYVDNKFIGSATPLRYRGRDHRDGREHGRAAADKMVIGRKGLQTSRPVKGQLT